jgi:hypothetical protein
MKQFIFLSITSFCLAACQKNKTAGPLSSDKNVSAVVFKAADNPSLPADVTGTISTDSIKFQLHKSISLNNLVPTISFSGRSISPSNHTQQNFNNTVTYTITAEDGTTENYVFRVNRVDSATLIAGHWRIIKDSLYDTPNFVNSTGGHPTPGVYTGNASDYWDLSSNGILNFHENGITFTDIHYQVLPNNKLSVDGLDVPYDPANIETLTSNTAIFSWAKTLSNGERYFRRLYLNK